MNTPTDVVDLVSNRCERECWSDGTTGGNVLWFELDRFTTPFPPLVLTSSDPL